MPDRTLLDDWLSDEDREQIDGQARAMLDAFAAQHGEDLHFDGLDLIHAWWWDLFSEVFLWEVRIATGVQNAITALAPDHVQWHGVDREQRLALEELTGQEGSAFGDEPAGPLYPSSVGLGWRAKAPVRLVRAAGMALGIPSFVRGNVLIQGDVGPAITSTHAGSITVAFNPRSLPAMGVRKLATLAFRGGWIGASTPARRASARRRLHRALGMVEGMLDRNPTGRLESFVALRATELLRQLAVTTIADYDVARRALAEGHLRAVVLPFDTPTSARALIQAAHHAGVPTLVLQHGFASGGGIFQEGTEGDVVAVWSQVDADLLRPRARGRIAVTGNPGAEHLHPRAASWSGGRHHTVVLVEYPFRMSARTDSRIKHRHVLTALRALAKTRPGTDVTIRPHPGDHEPRALEEVAGEFTAIRVRVDSSSHLAELLDGCDLVVAALSTAALEAGALGIPVIFLNSLGVDIAPPFDGSGDLPTASHEDQLIERIPAVLAAPEPPGLAELRTAFGMTPEAGAAVRGEVERLLASEPVPAA